MSQQVSRTVIAPLLGALVLVLASCGSTEIDKGKAESLVRQAMHRSNLASVSCPSGITAKKGGTFTCTVTGKDGSKGAVPVEMLDSSGAVRVHGERVQITPPPGAGQGNGATTTDTTGGSGGGGTP